MKLNKWVVTGLTVTALAIVSQGILAQRGQRGPRIPAPTFKSEEYLLLGTPMRGAGEPMIAVDPVDSKNMIAVAMGNLQQPEGKPVAENGTDAFHHITKSTITWLAVTHDGGLNWDVSELPILSGKLTRCPDSFADVMKDGTFIAGCEPRETMTSDPDFFGMSALMISHDHGKTWGPVVQLISDYQLNRFAPGLRPVSGGFPKGSPKRVASNSPWDRPFTYIDDSTGVIYAQAGGGQAYTDASETQRRSQAYVTASTDGGKASAPFTHGIPPNTLRLHAAPEWPRPAVPLSSTTPQGAYRPAKMPAARARSGASAKIMERHSPITCSKISSPLPRKRRGVDRWQRIKANPAVSRCC